MLLYVDKKKEKRRKIKIILSTLALILIIIINLICFNKTLHYTSQHLTTFSLFAHTHNWYDKSSPLTIFTKKGKKTPEIILFPSQFTRENSLTLTSALSKLSPSPYKIEFTSEVTNKEYLQQLTDLLNISNSTQNPQKIILTTNISKVHDIIKNNQLVPTSLTNQNTKNLSLSPELRNLLDTKFPLPDKPQTKLAKEKEALEKFIKLYQDTIKAFIMNTDSISYVNKHLFLQNNAICLLTNKNPICKTNQYSSLQKNIENAIKKLPPNVQVQKLLLLTSLEEVFLNAPLEEDDGLLFRYGNRKAILLPHEKDKKNNSYTLLKQKTGINSDYQTDDMKFYKFKTAEVILNDNI